MGVVVNLVTALFSRKHALSLIPWLCLYIALHGSYVLLEGDPFRGAAMRLARNYPGWASYLVVMLTAAVLAAMYWRVVRSGMAKLDTVTQPKSPPGDQGKSSSPTPATRPEEANEPPTPHHPIEITKKHTAKPQPTTSTTANTAEPVGPPVLRGPRLGTGPEAYKDLTDEQVGQWAIEEAEKIQEMAHRCIQDSIAEMKQGRSGNAAVYFLMRDFSECCAEDVKNLRAEVLARLGPPAKDPKEVSAWEMLISNSELPSARPLSGLYPMSIQEYAPHLRRLGRALRRRAVPLAAPLALRFSESQVPPERPGLPYRIVATIETKVPLAAGYIVVEFDGHWGQVGCDLKDVKSVMGGDPDMIDNKQLTDYLAAHQPMTTYAIKLGETALSPERPLHVVAASNKPLHVTRVTLFDD